MIQIDENIGKGHECEYNSGRLLAMLTFFTTLNHFFSVVYFTVYII